MKFQLIGSKRRAIIAVSILVVFYVAFGAALTIFQESVIYQPWPQDFANCPELADAKPIIVDGTRLYLKDNGTRVVVIYHGNAGSACDRASLAAFFEQQGYSYLLVEYGGYSNDSTSPTHERVKHDVENVARYIESSSFSSVTVFGESIGTGAAAYHSSLKNPSRLILVSPFSTLLDIAKHRFWFYPTSLLVNNAFDNISLLSDSREPILILHGDQDTLIPLALGNKLFLSLNPDTARFVRIVGAEHNTMYLYPETFEAIGTFLK